MPGKRTRGFTLLEVIISITVVSIISVFILEMFVVSNRVNKKANDLDNASVACTNAVEGFKAGAAASPGYYERYFNGDWALTQSAADAEYTLRVAVSRAHENDDIYDIDASVVNGEGYEVTSLHATKYFPDMGAGVAAR